jgi:hypothetical protein
MDTNLEVMICIILPNVDIVEHHENLIKVCFYIYIFIYNSQNFSIRLSHPISLKQRAV